MPVDISRRSRRAALVAVPLALLVGTVPARAQRATLERTTHAMTLPNGMQVIVVENHAIPVATAEVVVRTGAMTQDTDDQGVPHLFEHMLFKAYRGNLGQPFGADVSRIHAGYNGVTTEEAVAYYLTFPSSSADDALDVLARLLRDAHFDNSDLQMERFVVLNEYERALSEPRFHLAREVDARLWGSAFPRKNTIGDVTPLMGVNVRRLDDIFGRYYVPNNAALVVTGDVTTADIFGMARSHFAGWRRKPDPFVAAPIPPIPPLDTSRAVVISAGVNTVTVEVEWQGPSVGQDPHGASAADVLSDIVADEQSQFHQRLIDSGLFQEAGFEYKTLAHVGPITFRGVTTPARLPSALTALAMELTLMQDPGYFTSDAIAAAAKRRAVSTVFALEDGAELAHDVAMSWATGGLDSFLDYVDHLSACSASDLHALVTRYIARRPFVVGALVPPERSDSTALILQQYLAMEKDQ